VEGHEEDGEGHAEHLHIQNVDHMSNKSARNDPRNSSDLLHYAGNLTNPDQLC
jgi:hypothetical protein